MRDAEHAIATLVGQRVFGIERGRQAVVGR
jgi:hypothetical protein